MYGYHLRTAIEDIIVKVGLTEKRDTLFAALSGGMKRKLSLAIALIGDPKFLLLDGEYTYFIYVTHCYSVDTVYSLHFTS